MKNSINNIIFDVDGVLTDGSFYYDEKGKNIKNLELVMRMHLFY